MILPACGAEFNPPSLESPSCEQQIPRDRTVATERTSCRSDKRRHPASKDPPRRRIPEHELAAALGVSRVPVREAIRVLEQQGLPEIRPKKGTCVRKLSYEELEDGMRVRAALEKLAVKEAMARLDASEWDRLCLEIEVLIDRMRDAIERSEWLRKTQIDLNLHTRLVDAARNTQLPQIWAGLGLPLRFMAQTRTYGLATAEESALSLAEHKRLLDALRAKDLAACRAELDGHGSWQLRSKAQVRQAAGASGDHMHGDAEDR